MSNHSTTSNLNPKSNPGLRSNPAQKNNPYPITKITPKNPAWPDSFNKITPPPKSLYIRGNVALLKTLNISIVGTRKCTDYGRTQTARITQFLANLGLAIVSGLALGIDACAHEAALKNKAKTIAALGSGLETRAIYPPRHQNLAREILRKDGLLISEYPPTHPCLRHHFLERNRLIAALSPATIVIEAPEKSGARITARYAMEQGRDVFALPGDITASTSAGTNQLIKDGAHPIISVEDLIEDLKLIYNLAPDPKNQNQPLPLPHPALPKRLASVAALIPARPIHIDKIIERSTLDPVQVLSALTELELAGIIRNTGHSTYRRDS